MADVLETPPLPPALRVALYLGHGIERFALFLHAVLRDRPFAARAILGFAFIAFVGFQTRQPAHSDTLLNTINNNIQADTAGFFTGSFAVADALFSGVGFIIVMIVLAEYLVEHRTAAGVGRVLLKVILMIMIPFVVLKFAERVMPTWYNLALNLGRTITGQSIAPNPDGVFATGANLAKQLLMVVGQKIYADLMTLNITNLSSIAIDTVLLGVAIVSALILMVTFTILAVEILVAFAQGYIGLAVGAYQLGWSAARATAGYADAYWGLVMSVFTRIFVTMAIIAVGMIEANRWIAQIEAMRVLSSPAGFTTNILTMLQIPLMGVAFVMLTLKVTEFASAQLTGRPVQGGSSAISGAIGGTVKGAMEGGASGGIAGAVAGGTTGGLKGAMSGSSASRGGRAAARR